MTPKKAISELCKREGLKKQVDRAQMAEVYGHFSDLFWEEWVGNRHPECKSPAEVFAAWAITRSVLRKNLTFNLIDNGYKRAKKKARAKK